MMNSTTTLKLFLSLLLTTTLSLSGWSQCNTPNLEALSWSPQVPGPDDEVRFVVSKEYADGCQGLDQKGWEVDEVNKVIYLHFDVFCDTSNCTTAVHCDSAHYVVSGLNVADYEIMVVDTNESNNICDSVPHVTNLDSGTLKVRQFTMTSVEVVVKNGSYQCIPFYVTGFDGLNTLQASLTWDSLLLEYDTTRNLYPIADFTPGNVSLRTANDLRVIWIDFNVDGESIPDGEAMFEVCYNVIGTSVDTAVITYDEEFIPFEVEDVEGNKIEVIKTDATVYINDEYYGECEVDTADILCVDWVKDSVLAALGSHCADTTSDFSIDLVTWRGWQMLGFNYTTNGEGQKIYYSCDGQYVGSCFVGGPNDGVCDNALLNQDLTIVDNVWSCGDALPGCYTTANSDLYVNGKILVNNLSNGVLMVKGDFIGKTYKIFNLNGSSLGQGILDENLDISQLASGTYYLMSDEQIERFIKID